MQTPTDKVLAARLDMALLKSDILAAPLVADRMVDRHWQEIPARLLADLLDDTEDPRAALQPTEQALGLPSTSPASAMKMTLDWLAYLIVEGLIKAPDVRSACWALTRIGRPAEADIPLDPPLSELRSQIYWWMDNCSEMPPTEYAETLHKSFEAMLATCQTILTSPDWSYHGWPTRVLTDTALLTTLHT